MLSFEGILLMKVQTLWFYLGHQYTDINYLISVRTRARIGPPPPFVCRKRRLNGAVLRMRPEKPRPRVTAGVAQ